MTTPDEKEDLEALLRSNGWLRFARHAEDEWQTKFADKVRTAIGVTDDARALTLLRQVTVAKEAVETLLRWPHERLMQLEQKSANLERAQSVPLSRRGPL